jgi:hypothetical protein
MMTVAIGSLLSGLPNLMMSTISRQPNNVTHLIWAAPGVASFCGTPSMKQFWLEIATSGQMMRFKFDAHGAPDDFRGIQRCHALIFLCSELRFARTLQIALAPTRAITLRVFAKQIKFTELFPNGITLSLKVIGRIFLIPLNFAP